MKCQWIQKELSGMCGRSVYKRKRPLLSIFMESVLSLHNLANFVIIITGKNDNALLDIQLLSPLCCKEIMNYTLNC